MGIEMIPDIGQPIFLDIFRFMHWYADYPACSVLLSGSVSLFIGPDRVRPGNYSISLCMLPLSTTASRSMFVLIDDDRCRLGGMMRIYGDRDALEVWRCYIHYRRLICWACLATFGV